MHEMHEIIAADALTPAARCRHRQQHQWQQQGASPNRGQVVKVNWTHEMTHVKHQVQPLFFLTHWDSPVSPSTTHFTKMVWKITRFRIRGLQESSTVRRKYEKLGWRRRVGGWLSRSGAACRNHADCNIFARTPLLSETAPSYS